MQPAHQKPQAASQLNDTEKLGLLDELEQAGMGWFWASDSAGNLTYLSASLAERMRLSSDQLVGQPFAKLFTPVDGEVRTKPLSLMFGAHKAFSGVTVCSSNSDASTVLRLSGRPVFDAQGKFMGFRGTGWDISEEHHREAETARLAKYDSLTGLLNRHRMAHLIDTTLTAFKAAKRNCAIMMMDLDKFKHVNDTLGHAAGDELLKQVADRLTRSIDRECEIGRLGGDEFQIMVPDVDDRGVLGELAKKVITMLSQPYSLDEGRCVIGASVGIAIAPHDGVTADEIVRSADLALYSAKNGGRGQFRFFSGDLENEALFRRRLEEDLEAAVRDGQLFLKYQPIVSGSDQNVRALEAKICWNHPQRGEIDDEEFASIFEGSSAVVEVGRWAIETACKSAMDWPSTVRVSVNVPVQLFRTDQFVDDVAQALQDSELPASRLELEISEAIFFGDTHRVDRTLGLLFKLGVRLTLDEFGSGHSSLAYLRRAPFDALKIDDKLIAEAAQHDSRDLGLIKAIVALAQALEMETIADGVETIDLNDALLKSGLTFIQGDIYSEPVAGQDVLGQLNRGEWKIAPDKDRTKRAKRRTVFRKIQVIHDDHSYEVTLRNLSKSGALIEGLLDVPKGTQFVVDLGAGQLAVASVIRSNGDTQGLEFEQSLVDDGSGGLCTRNRVSPYALASAGAPLSALSQGDYKGMEGGMLGQSGGAPKFGYAPTARSDAS
jgi:diguanylate cyclase (GGDEF)-like protein